MENKIFNELALRDEIVKVWGPHGCHADVFNKMIKRHNPLLSFPEMWDYEIKSASLIKILIIRLFPGIFYKIVWRKHQRYLNMRYPNE